MLEYSVLFSRWMRMPDDSQSILVTVPTAWKLEKHATNRKFASIQDLIRELVRRDIEAFDKEAANDAKK